MDIAAFAPALGVFATVLFVLSQAPMLIKAARTKDLASYSGSNLVIANIGNVAQTGYVVTLPAGPVWALHAFNMASSGCMLFWWLRHARRGRRVSTPGPQALPDNVLAFPVHKSRTSSGVRARETHGNIVDLAS